MRTLVCGGRNFNDIDFFVKYLNRIHEEVSPITHVISGAARGADTLAIYWAEEMGVSCTECPADWKADGKGAGFKRNREMLEEYAPELVVAFPGGNGTQDTVERAQRMKIDVWQSKYVLFTKENPTYGFLSNFAPDLGFHSDDGRYWQTTEHYYQAMKSPFRDEQDEVMNCKTANGAKQKGSRINMRDDWECPPWETYGGHKEVVMRQALAYKFAQGTAAAKLLLNTGHDYLVEYTPWGDDYWGVVDQKHTGQNRLGVLLMERRDELERISDPMERLYE